MGELTFRSATPSDLGPLRELIIDSFEPITWYKKVDDLFGPLNGQNWRARWEQRLDKIFASQMMLIGEAEGEIVAVATGTVNEFVKLGFVDLLAVDLRHQNKGYGRAMLRGMLDHLKALGMEHVHLDCLTDNARGNALYEGEGWTKVASSNHWLMKL